MGAGADVHGLQGIVLLLLVLVVLFALLARRIHVPYSIVLVVAGLLISFVPHVPRIRLDPDLVFLIFLPPLLYASAWQTSWREFRRNLLSISMLAIGLVAFTVWGVAEFADHFIAALDWKAGFVLGAVVAATDAIAAASVASAIGLPKRIVDILEGESLLNDGTALLALEFGLLIVVKGETPTVAGGLLRLLWLIAGGVGVGVLLAIVTAWIEQWVNDGPIEVLISLIVPYVAYLLGEEVRASGVLSVVACGLYLSRKSAHFFLPEVRIQVMSVWSGLNFALNGIVFVLIGLQLPYVLAGIRGYGRGTLIAYGLVFSAVLIVLRLVWVYPAQRFAFWVQQTVLRQRVQRPSARGIFVVGWTGMRGVVALAAAISLPEQLANGRPFEQRNLIIFLTFCVILVTLVVQGLTLPAVIRGLGLAGVGGDGGAEERGARRTVLTAAIEFLEQGRSTAPSTFTHGYDDLLHRYRHRMAAVEGEPVQDDGNGLDAETYQHLRAVAGETVQVERQTMIALRDSGAIGDDVLRRLEHELDLTETRQRTELR